MHRDRQQDSQGGYLVSPQSSCSPDAHADYRLRITHGPPFKVLDQVMAGTHVGCEALAERLPELRPRLHLFGHIHEGHGLAVQEWEQSEETLTTEKNRVELSDGVPHTIFANAASWPMGKLVREPQEFGSGAFMPIIVDLRED